MESVLLNPVELCKVISDRYRENLNMITVSSAWEQKEVVNKGEDYSVAFLFSYRGLN